MAKHKFTSENQPAVRNTRGKGWRTLILEEFEKKGLSENAFIEYVISRALDKADAQSGKLLGDLISRLDPAPKSTAPLVTFEFPAGGSMVEKIDAIIKATSEGTLPADLAQMIAGMLKTRMDIQDITELAVRLDKLEKVLASRGA
jgi:hypothetical protein